MGNRILVADKPTLDSIARAVGVVGDNKIYGVKINKKDSNPDTRCTYLGDAVGKAPAYMDFSTGKFNYGDWEDAWFVKKNFPCMLKNSGVVDYKLNPNDYSLKEDGTVSDYNNINYSGNAMSAMPLVWLWQYETVDYKYIYVANYKVNDNYHAYAHQRENGTVSDYIYMSMFKGSHAVDSIGRDSLRSLGGLPGSTTMTKGMEEDISSALANCAGQGKGWYIKTWSQRNLMQCLLTLMFCSTDSQSKLGLGNTRKGEVLTTGTISTKGQFYGDQSLVSQVKAFHQEAVWGDQWDRIVGLVNINGTIGVKMTAPYDITSSEGYTQFNIPPKGTSGGYINDTIMTQFGDIPIEAKGSGTTFECDSLWFDNQAYSFALVGGHSNATDGCGLYALDLHRQSNALGWYIGASLSYTPQ